MTPKEASSFIALAKILLHDQKKLKETADEPTTPTRTVAQYLADYLNQCHSRSPLSSASVHWRRDLAQIGFDETVDEKQTPEGYTNAIYLKDGSILRRWDSRWDSRWDNWPNGWSVYLQGNDRFSQELLLTRPQVLIEERDGLQPLKKECEEARAEVKSLRGRCSFLEHREFTNKNALAVAGHERDELQRRIDIAINQINRLYAKHELPSCVFDLLQNTLTGTDKSKSAHVAP